MFDENFCCTFVRWSSFDVVDYNACVKQLESCIVNIEDP